MMFTGRVWAIWVGVVEGIILENILEILKKNIEIL